MELPPALRWVDVDFPAMIEYKTHELRAETPRCRYDAVAADLSNAAERREVLNRVAGGASRVLILAEGLLIYLTEEQVRALATDLAAMPGARWWFIDLASARLLEWMNRSWGKSVQAGTARFMFAPKEGTKFFDPTGWTEERFISSTDAAKRLNRQMKGMWLWQLIGKLYPRRIREQMKRFSGYVLLKRA
jgi:O-methyltransferase involved in polyketide biosynthesis